MTTTGDGNYLALNSTVLTLGVIVLLGVVLVAMIALGGGGLFSKSSSQRFAQEPYQEELYNAEETEFQTRYRRSASGNFVLNIFALYKGSASEIYWSLVEAKNPIGWCTTTRTIQILGSKNICLVL